MLYSSYALVISSVVLIIVVTSFLSSANHMQNLNELALFLSTAAGSGLAASWLFDRLRAMFPYPQTAPANALVAWLYRLLWAPRHARYTSIALAILVASVASGAAVALTGAEFDAIAAAMAAPVVAQLRHALTLPSE